MSPLLVWSTVYLQGIRDSFSQAQSSASSALAASVCQAARGDYKSLQGAYYQGTKELYEQCAFVLIDLREAKYSNS